MRIRWKRNHKSLHCASLHKKCPGNTGFPKYLFQVLAATQGLRLYPIWKHICEMIAWHCLYFSCTLDTQPLHQRRMRSIVAILRHPRSATEALMQTQLLLYADVDVSAAALVISTRPPASEAITPSGQAVNKDLKRGVAGHPSCGPWLYVHTI